VQINIIFVLIIMNSKRQQKFARLIQRDLGEIFLRDTKGMFGSAFITVSRVEISPDLGVAKVYLSFMMVNDKEALLKEVRTQTKMIRQTLGVKIRHQARIIPQLVFFLDESVDYAMKMDSVFKDLHIPPTTPLEENDYDKLDK